MNDFSLPEVLAMSITPIVNAARRFFIRIELNNVKYALAQIAVQRANDTQVETLMHRRQALLQSELRRLEAK